MKRGFAVIGCGRAGRAFAKYLSEAGYTPAGFASKSLESARNASGIAGGSGIVSTRAWEVVREADIILFTTPDDAIQSTAEEVAAHGSIKKDAVAYHCSGALSSAELSALKGIGANIGSLHPLQSFSASPEKNPFEGIMIGIEGDRDAVDIARQMAKELGATPFEIETSGKMLYHASAVAASNYLVTLMKFAMDLLLASGVDRERLYGILKPLIMGTLSNIERTGPVEALTGPIVRGDTAIVGAHVRAIGANAPQMSELYKTMGKYTVEIASQRNSISEETRQEMLSIFEENR